jgi:hypothetical protein
MSIVSGNCGRKAAGLAAAYLHAFVLLVSLVLVPADPLFKTYENATTLALTDAAPDEAVQDVKLDGDDKSFWTLAQQARVGLRDGERRCHSQEAPRASGCGRSFHARGPPALTI